jgi:hypothetical protein
MAAVYLHNEDGTKAAYSTEEEALAQAAHDAKYGFQVPVKITDEDGTNVLANKDSIKKAADKL